jgi:adenosylcobinamide-GDP ribazoletransferase
MNDSASQPGSSGRPTHFWREEIGLAMVFLTRLPWPGRLPESRPLMAAAWAFPVVGVGVGLIAAFAYWIAHGLGLPASIAALSAIAAAAKRRIMRDSHIGSYGVLALVLATAAKVAALAALADVETAVVALVTAHALGRSMIPALAHWLPPAAPDGRGRDAGRPDTIGALWAAGIGVGVALLILPAGIGLAAALAAGGAAAAIGWLARRQIGGVTGDVFGAAEQLGEIAALFAIVSYLGS